MECVPDGRTQVCLLQAKLFNRSDGDINFKTCTSKDCTALVTELNESLKKIEKLSCSFSEAGDTTESCDATTVEENTEAEKKDENPQDSAKKSRKRKHISNSPSTSCTTVFNVDESAESERDCENQEPTNKNKKNRKISNSTSASSTTVIGVDDNTESEREDETPQEPTNKSKRKKKVSNSSPASSTTVEAPLPDAMQESCEKCLLTSKWCFPHLEP